MKSRLSRIALGMAALLALSPAFADRVHPVMVEEAIETEAGLVLFSSSGELTVRACSACALQTFKFDARTTYSVAGKPATQAAWVLQSRAKPASNAVVFYRLSDNFISRVVAGS